MKTLKQLFGRGLTPEQIEIAKKGTVINSIIPTHKTHYFTIDDSIMTISGFTSDYLSQTTRTYNSKGQLVSKDKRETLTPDLTKKSKEYEPAGSWIGK